MAEGTLTRGARYSGEKQVQPRPEGRGSVWYLWDAIVNEISHGLPAEAEWDLLRVECGHSS